MKIKKSSISLLGISIWSLASFFFLYEFFLRTFIGSVAHQVIPDLKLNAETFSIVGSAYYVTYGLMQIPVGILTDKFGVKPIMVFATLVCALSTLFFAHATGFNSAFASRLLMGFGSSFAFICLLVIAITWFPQQYFGFFAGASQFIGTMGPLLAGGPLIAMMAASHETWRQALSTISVVGIVLAVLTLLIVKSKPRDSEKTLIFLQPEEPLKESLLRLLKNKQAWYIALYSAAVYMAIAFLGAIWGTEYLQVRGLSQTYAANMVSLSWLGYALGCLLLGGFSDLTKRRRPSLIFCALLGLLSTAAITFLNFEHLPWVYAILFFALGVSASGQNVGFAAIAEHVAPRAKATALGLNNGAITLFAAIMPPLASYFIYLSAGSQSNQLHANNFTLGFALMPILYFISLVLACFAIKETYCKPQKAMILLEVN